jgi:hypothetical protein
MRRGVTTTIRQFDVDVLGIQDVTVVAVFSGCVSICWRAAHGY